MYSLARRAYVDPVLRARLLKEVTTLDSANSLSAIVCPALFLSKEVDQARYRLVDVVRGIADNKKRDNDSDCSLLAQLIKSETGLPFEDIYMGVIGTMLAAFINTAGTLTWYASSRPVARSIARTAASHSHSHRCTICRAMAELLHPEYGTKWLYVHTHDYHALANNARRPLTRLVTLRVCVRSEQVYAEQQQIIAEHGEGLSMAAINAMEVLNRIIMETGRKYSLFGHFRLVEQEERWRDYVFPKGEFVSYPIVIANLNPEIHPNPELFNPDRFLRPEAKSTFNLMQFGAGVHRCKGYVEALLFTITTTTTMSCMRNSHPDDDGDDDDDCSEFFALMVLKVMMALWVRKYKSHLLCPNFPGTDPTHVGGIYSPDAPLPFTVEPRA